MSFNPSNGNISSAGDVALNNSASNDVLTYDASVAKWTNKVLPVQSVAGKAGAVTLTKTDVSLGNVDNTADTAKPISTAQQIALDTKPTRSTVAKIGYRVKQASGAYPSTSTINRTYYYVIFLGPLDPYVSGDAQPGDEHEKTDAEIS